MRKLKDAKTVSPPFRICDDVRYGGMTESEEVSGRKRRSSAEIKRLVTEFQTSGLRQNEFCRNHGLALSSLQRQLKKRRRDQGEVKESGGLVAVELADKERAGKDRSSSALEVVLSGGRRIEVRPGFDSNTLERLLSVLERE
jgi:hypothetical protein